MKNTASLNFLPRYFYYAPKLDQNSSEFCKKNSSILWSEVTLFQKIRNNATKALRKKYMDDFKKSYRNVLDSIITNTSMLTNVDYGYLLNSNRFEEQKLAQALDNMWPNINSLYDILYDGGYETSEIKAVIIWLIEYSVSMLNSAIEGILPVTHRIIGADKASSTDVSGFISQLQKNVNKPDIPKFAKKIEAYLDNLLQVEELLDSNHFNVHSKIAEIDPYISIAIKSDFSKTKKQLSEINLDKAVFKSFRLNLTKLTSVLKEKTRRHNTSVTY